MFNESRNVTELRACMTGNVSWGTEQVKIYCKMHNMSFGGGTGLFSNGGCVDKDGEIHLYKVEYSDDGNYVTVGNETFKAKYNGC